MSETQMDEESVAHCIRFYHIFTGVELEQKTTFLWKRIHPSILHAASAGNSFVTNHWHQWKSTI